MTRRKPATTRARACDGKARHATAEAAGHARRALIAQGAPPDRLTTYPCDFGPHFHVGHTPRGKR